MANDEVRIKIKIDANTQELVLMKNQVLDLGKSFSNSNSTASAFASKLDTLNNKVNAVESSFNKTDSIVSSFTNRILKLGGAYLILNAAIDGGKKFIQQADTMNLLDGRLKLATSSLSEYNLQQQELTKISLDSHTAITDTTTLFTKLNPALKQVGATTGQVDSIVSTFTKGLQLGGANAAESSSAILQFSQAMGSGVLRGEEFNAMAEASPKLLEYLAKGLGVPQTALKKMAEEGELTAVKVSNALLSVKSDIDRDFKTMPVIVEKAMTDLSTYMSLGIRDIDKATGASTALSGAILGFGKDIGNISGSVITFYEDAINFIKNHNEALDTTGTIVKAVTVGYVGFAVTSGIATGINTITTSVVALRASILALEFSIPVLGWVAGAVGVLAGAWVYNHETMNKAIGGNIEDIEKLQTAQELLAEKAELSKKKAKIQNDKFMWDSEQATLVGELNTRLEITQTKLDAINKAKGMFNIIPKEKTNFEEIFGIDEYAYYKKADSIKEIIVRNEDELIKLSGTARQKLDLDIKNNIVKMKNAGATQIEIEKYKNEQITEFTKKEASKQDAINNKALELSKTRQELAKIGLTEYEIALANINEKTIEWQKKGVSENEILTAKIKLQDELNKKTNFENLKENISFYERKIQLLDNTIDKEKELQGIAYTNRLIEIEGSNKSREEKDKLIAKEIELNNLTIQSMNARNNIEFQDTMSNFYDDMLDSQLALNNAVYDFGSGFDGVSSKIGAVSKSIAAMSSLELTNKKEASKLDKKYIEQFNKYAGDVDKTNILALQYSKDKAILDEQNIQAQLAGYANIAGAMSNMFTQGSRDAAAFHLIESGLALATGIRAILTQGSGDPYTAFARMASMAAIVSSMLGNIGVAFGLNKTTTSSDSFSAMTANNGSGSTLGDSKQSSKSITDSLSTLKDFAEPQYKILLEMNNNLTSINEKISGVSSLLIQTGGFAFGQGYTGYSTGYKNNLSLGNSTTSSLIGGAGVLAGLGAYGGFGAMGALSVAGPMGLALMGVDKLLLGGTLTNAFSGIVNSVLGGVFGKTSVSQSLTDSGIYFADTLLSSAIKEFDGQAYQTITTTTTKKSWFSKSSSSVVQSYFDQLDAQTERQFSLVLDNLYNTVLVSGTALDSASEQTANSLSNFVVSLGKISLKDKTGTQIQEELTNVFAKVGDDLARTAFPLLNDFQKVGEGLFSTLTRVATGIQTADFYIGKLGNRFSEVTYTAIGNKQGDVGFEALLQSIEKVEAATYPVNNNLLNVVDSLDTTADKLYTVYTALDELRDRLIFIGQSAQGISSSMISGAGGVDALSSGFKAYFDKFLTDGEQLAYKTSQIAQSFNDLGLALPVSKDSFKALLSGIDLTSEAGQELYGRLITLSESFADVADSTTKSITDLTTSLKDLSTSSFTTFTDSLKGISESITSLKQTALSFINGFTTSNDATLKDQIVSYNKLRNQFSSYFDENGIIKAGVNKDTVSGLYSSMTSLATSISNKDGVLKDNLISMISSDLVKFNSAEDILKVNIVDGLGSLYNLTKEQTTKLQSIALDGKITNSELNSISGLTQAQKDGILEFASNSTYFSTEGTLSSLNEYAKKQLEVLQAAQSNETANLSSQTFKYGDYIGKQEQIDIATKLGVSYDSAKPLVERLQALSISKNPTADLQSILGYKAGGTTYDRTVASQIQALSPYLTNIDLNGTIAGINSNIQSTIAQQQFEASKAEFYSRFSQAQSQYEALAKADASVRDSYLASWVGAKGWSITAGNSEDLAKGIIATRTVNQYGNKWQDENKAVDDALKAKYADAFNQAYSSYLNVQSLLKEKALKGFFLGGYSGDISPNAIAGIVHGGEHIIDHNVTSQINQIGSVTDMINQYMNQNFYQKMLDVFQYMSTKLEENTQILIAQANEIKKLRKETEFKGAV